jgi:hypothetical protein
LSEWGHMSDAQKRYVLSVDAVIGECVREEALRAHDCRAIAEARKLISRETPFAERYHARIALSPYFLQDGQVPAPLTNNTKQ